MGVEPDSLGVGVVIQMIVIREEMERRKMIQDARRKGKQKN